MSLRDFQLPLSLCALLLSACAVGPSVGALGGSSPTQPGSGDSEVRIEPPSQQALQPSSQAQVHILAGELAAARDQPEQAAQQFLLALEQAPDAALAGRATALALSARNAELSEAAARRWLELEPGSMEAREIIARMSLTHGALAEAYTQSLAIVEGHAGGPEEGFRQVALLLSQSTEDADAALSLMSQLLAKYPSLSGAHYATGLVALRFERNDLAEKESREAQRLDPSSKEAGLLLAGVLVRKDSIPQADTVVAELVRKSPKEAEDLRMAYVKLLLDAGKTQPAAAQLRRIVEANPKNAGAQFALGLVALSNNDAAEARKRFEAVKNDPERGSDARYQLGRMAEIEHHYEEALKYYESINSGSQMIDAAVRRAAVLAQLGRIGDARSLLGQLRQHFPPLGPRLYAAEGEILSAAGQYKEAIALYDRALAETPGDPDLLYGRSLAHEELGHIDLAAADLRSILAEDANDPRSLNALGYMLAEHTQEYQEAEKLISRALALTPEDPAVIDSMGWVRFKLGQPAEARTLLEKAYAKMKDPEIAAHLGEVLWHIGDREQARKVWSEALTEEPDNAGLKATIERLDR